MEVMTSAALLRALKFVMMMMMMMMMMIMMRTFICLN